MFPVHRRNLLYSLHFSLQDSLFPSRLCSRPRSLYDTHRVNLQYSRLLNPRGNLLYSLHLNHHVCPHSNQQQIDDSINATLDSTFSTTYFSTFFSAFSFAI